MALRDLESLGLQWLTFNVDTFDKWGGWVSEKYQSLARVALWVYGPLMVMDDVPQFVAPRGRNFNDWLVGDYRKWLRVRGLPEEGAKDELRKRIKGYMDLPEGEQPRVLPPEYGSADGVMVMLRRMVLMLTTLLQPAVEGEVHANILALRIRLFLNSVEEFDKPLRLARKMKQGKKRKDEKKNISEEPKKKVGQCRCG